MQQTEATSARGRGFWALQQMAAPYLFLSPFIILFCIFFIYPLWRSLSLSFYKTVGAGHEKFVGGANYAFLVHDQLFWLAVANTVGYTAVFLTLQIPASLLLAILLNSNHVIGRPILRFAYFSTHLVGSIFVAILFAQMLSPRIGLLNHALSGISGKDVEINWLGEPSLALVAVLMAGLWLSIGNSMIYFLASLQAVDADLYEAADIDGASQWQQLLNVTLPGIRPVLMFLVLTGTIGCLQMFELPFLLFQQSAGPLSRALTIVMYLFQTGWGTGDLGYASAIGWVLVLMVVFVAFVQWRIVRRIGT